MKEKRVDLRKKPNFFIKAVVFAFMGFCLVTLVSQQLTFASLNEQEEELLAEIAVLEEDVEEIQDDLNRPFDDEYVKKVARAKLNYHLPEEIIYYNDLEK